MFVGKGVSVSVDVGGIGVSVGESVGVSVGVGGIAVSVVVGTGVSVSLGTAVPREGRAMGSPGQSARSPSRMPVRWELRRRRERLQTRALGRGLVQDQVQPHAGGKPAANAEQALRARLHNIAREVGNSPQPDARCAR